MVILKKIVMGLFAVADMTTVAGAVLCRSGS